MSLIHKRHGDAIFWEDGNGLWLGAQGPAFPDIFDTAVKPPAGAVFWRQDLSDWYVWNQSGWELVGGGGPGGGLTLSAGTESVGAGVVKFENSNGISFGMNAGTITGTVKTDYLTTAAAPPPFAASDVTNARIAAPTYTNLQQMHNLTRSAGHLDGGVVTQGAGETVNVSAGQGFIRATDDDTSTLYTFDWAAATGLAIPTDTIRYIVVEYNGGSPQLVVYTSESYDYRTAFPIGIVVNEGGTLYINNTPHSTGRVAGRFSRRNYEVDGRSRANALGGLIISESGTAKTLAVTAGVTWWRGIRESFSAFDSDGSDTFDRYYRDGSGGWTVEAGQTVVPDGLYDDNTPPPTTIGNNRYVNYWFYLGPSGAIIMVYGRVDHANLASANAEQPYGDLPLRLQVGALLLGRFIVNRSGAVYSVVQADNAFSAGFTPSPTADHGALAGLADDDHTQYALSSEGVINSISAGTTSQSTGQVIFSNSNGVSFGLDAGTLTATVRTDYQSAGAYLTTAMASNRGSDFVQATAAFAGTSASGTIASNGISVSIGPYITTAALSNHSHGASAANGVFSFQTLSFSNANGISFGTSAGPAITASHNALTSQSNQAFSADASSTFQTLSFQDSNGISFSNNAGALRVTHALQFTSNTSNITSAALHTSAALRAIYDGANSISTGTIRFTNANGVTFSINGQTISGSVAAQTNQTGGIYVTAQSTGQSSSSTYDLRTLSFVPDGIISAGWSGGSFRVSATQSNQAASASNGSFTFQTLNFSNANNVTFGTSAGGVVTASVAAPGAAAENNWVTLGGNVAGDSSASGSTINWIGGNNVTLSGTNGSQVIISAGAGGAAYTAYTFQNRQLGATTTINSMGGLNSMWIAPFRLAAPVSASTLIAMASFSGTITSAATAQNGGTLRFGIYSQNATNTSRFDSHWTDALSWTFWNSGTSSCSYAVSGSGGNTTSSSAGSNLLTASVMGVRHFSMFPNSIFPAGLYCYAQLCSTSSAGYSAAMSREAFYFDNPMSVGGGSFPGGATNNSIGYADGGTLRTTTAALPASFGFSNIGQVANVMPWFKMGAL